MSFNNMELQKNKKETVINTGTQKNITEDVFNKRIIRGPLQAEKSSSLKRDDKERRASVGNRETQQKNRAPLYKGSVKKLDERTMESIRTTSGLSLFKETEIPSYGNNYNDDAVFIERKLAESLRGVPLTKEFLNKQEKLLNGVPLDFIEDTREIYKEQEGSRETDQALAQSETAQNTSRETTRSENAQTHSQTTQTGTQTSQTETRETGTAAQTQTATTKEIPDLTKRPEYKTIEELSNAFESDKSASTESFRKAKFAVFALKSGVDSKSIDLKEYGRLVFDAYASVKAYYDAHRSRRYSFKGKRRKDLTKKSAASLESIFNSIETQIEDSGIITRSKKDPESLKREQGFLMEYGFDIYTLSKKPWDMSPEELSKFRKDQEKQTDIRKKWLLGPHLNEVKELLKDYYGSTDEKAEKIFNWELERYNENVQMNTATLEQFAREKCKEMGLLGLEATVVEYISKMNDCHTLDNPKEFNAFIDSINISEAILDGAAAYHDKKERLSGLMENLKDNEGFWENAKVKTSLLDLKAEDFEGTFEVLKEKVNYAQNMVKSIIYEGFSPLTRDAVFGEAQKMLAGDIFLNTPSQVRAKLLTLLDTPAHFMGERKLEANMKKAMEELEIEATFQESCAQKLKENIDSVSLPEHDSKELEKIKAFLSEQKKAGAFDSSNESLKKEPKTLKAIEKSIGDYYYKNMITGENFLGKAENNISQDWLSLISKNIDELVAGNPVLKEKFPALQNIKSGEDFETLPYNEFKKIAQGFEEFAKTLTPVFALLERRENTDALAKEQIVKKLLRGEINKDNWEEGLIKEQEKVDAMERSDDFNFQRHLFKPAQNSLISYAKGKKGPEYAERVRNLSRADGVWKKIREAGLERQFTALLKLKNFDDLLAASASENLTGITKASAIGILSKPENKVPEGEAFSKPAKVLKRILGIVQSKQENWPSEKHKNENALDIAGEFRLCGMGADFYNPGTEREDLLTGGKSDYKKSLKEAGNTLLERYTDLGELLYMKKGDIIDGAGDEPALSESDRMLLRDRCASLMAGIRPVSEKLSPDEKEKTREYNKKHFGVEDWDEARSKLLVLITNGYMEAFNKKKEAIERGDLLADDKFSFFDNEYLKTVKETVYGKGNAQGESGGNGSQNTQQSSGQEQDMGRRGELLKIAPKEIVERLLDDRENWHKIILSDSEAFNSYKNELKQRLLPVKTELDSLTKNGDIFSGISAKAFLDEHFESIIKGDTTSINKVLGLKAENTSWKDIITKYDKDYAGTIRETERDLKKTYGNNYVADCMGQFMNLLDKEPAIAASLTNRQQFADLIKTLHKKIKFQKTVLPKFGDLEKIFGDDLGDLDKVSTYDAYIKFLGDKILTEDEKTFKKNLKEAYPQSFINGYKAELRAKEEARQNALGELSPKEYEKEIFRTSQKSKELLKEGKKKQAELFMIKNQGLKADAEYQKLLSFLRFYGRNDFTGLLKISNADMENYSKIKGFSAKRKEEASTLIEKILKRGADKNIIKREISPLVKTILSEEWNINHNKKAERYVKFIGKGIDIGINKINELSERKSISKDAESLQELYDTLLKDEEFKAIKDKELLVLFMRKFGEHKEHYNTKEIKKDPAFITFKYRIKRINDIEGLNVANRYLALEKEDVLANLKTGVLMLDDDSYRRLVSNREKYFKYADSAYNEMDKAVDEYLQRTKPGEEAAKLSFLRESLLQGLRIYSKGHILNEATSGKPYDEAKEKERLKNILNDRDKINTIVSGAFLSLDSGEEANRIIKESKFGVINNRDLGITSITKTGLQGSYEGQYTEGDLLNRIVTMKDELNYNYVNALARGTDHLKRKKGYIALNEEEKRLFALALTLITNPGEGLGTLDYTKGKNKTQGNLLDARLKVQEFLRTGKITGDIDYTTACLRLKNADNTTNVRAFDDALKFTKFMIERKNALAPKDDSILSTPELTISFAEKYKDFKGIKALSEKDIETEGDFKTEILKQMEADKNIKFKPGNSLTYLREGMGHVKEWVRIDKIRKRVESFTPAELHMFVMILQDRTILDVSQKDEFTKFKEGTKIGYVNEPKRKAMFAACVNGGEEFDSLFTKAQGKNFLKQALKTMYSFQLKDGEDYKDKSIKAKNLVSSSFVRVSKVDWLLIKRAIDLIDDAKAQRNKDELISHTSNYVLYSGNKKAVDEYKRMEQISKQGDGLTTGSLVEFLMKNAKSDMANDPDIGFLIGRITTLSRQEAALFVKALGHRDALDLSKKNLVKNIFGKGDRDFQNTILRNKMLDEYMKTGLGGHAPKLTSKDLMEAVKGTLSAQISDDVSLSKYKNANIKDVKAGERLLIEGRNTAIDWKLVRRALLFVTDAKKEMNAYKEHREIYRMLGDLNNGQFDFDYGIMRRNTEMTFGGVGRFFSIASQPAIDFVSNELKDKIKSLGLDELSGFIYSCVSEEQLNRLSFLSDYYGDGENGYLNKLGASVKGKINDRLNYTTGGKFIRANLKMDNITDATKFVSDGRMIIDTEELKKSGIKRGVQMLGKIVTNPTGVPGEFLGSKLVKPEDKEEEKVEKSYAKLLELGSNTNDFRKAAEGLYSQIEALNINTRANDSAQAKYDMDRIRKELGKNSELFKTGSTGQNELSKEIKEKTVKPDDKTQEALNDIAKELLKPDDKSIWDHLKESDDLVDQCKESFKRWLRVDKLQDMGGGYAKFASLLELGINEGLKAGIKAGVNAGVGAVSGTANDLQAKAMDAFLTKLNDEIPEDMKPLVGVTSAAVGNIAKMFASGSKYANMAVKIIKSGKDIVLAAMNTSYLEEEMERAKAERIKDKARVDEAVDFNKTKDEERASILSKGYLKTVMFSNLSGGELVSANTFNRVVTACGDTFGIAAELAGDFTGVGAMASRALNAGVRTAFAVVNAIRDSISSERIIKEYMAGDEGAAALMEAKKAREASLRMFGQKDTKTYREADNRSLLMKHLGYDSADAFAKALGEQAIASLLFAASKYNGLNGEKIVAVAVMHILGMSDSIGKYDEQTATTMYERLMLHKSAA